MGEKTDISWTDSTINLWWGCTKISPGCAHCYADSLAHRFGKDVWGPGKPREDHREGARKTALKLNKQAEKEGRRFRVFSASMSDWLDEEVPIEWFADLLTLIESTPNLDWLLLTKRPGNWLQRAFAAFGYVADDAKGWLESWLAAAVTGPMAGAPPDNVWIGTTVEDQARAEERIPQVLRIPARVRFLSCEPLLEEVDISFGLPWPEEVLAVYEPVTGTQAVDWVIVGGESGGKARPMEIEWARSLKDQCAAAGVAFFMKQDSGLTPGMQGRLSDELFNTKEFPNVR